MSEEDNKAIERDLISKITHNDTNGIADTGEIQALILFYKDPKNSNLADTAIKHGNALVRFAAVNRRVPSYLNSPSKFGGRRSRRPKFRRHKSRRRRHRKLTHHRRKY